MHIDVSLDYRHNEWENAGGEGFQEISYCADDYSFLTCYWKLATFVKVDDEQHLFIGKNRSYDIDKVLDVTQLFLKRER
jgi:hypothetical protein